MKGRRERRILEKRCVEDQAVRAVHRGREYLSDAEVHHDSPPWSIFNGFKEWWGIRRELDLNEKQRRDKLIVSINVICVLEFDMLSHMIDAILCTRGEERGGVREEKEEKGSPEGIHSKRLIECLSRRSLAFVFGIIWTYSDVESGVITNVPMAKKGGGREQSTERQHH
jgi:hypothetical protein